MAKGGLLQSLKRMFSSIKLKRCGKKTRRISRKSKKSKKSQKGGGYSEQLNLSIYPGQQVHQAYSGPGYDCAGSPARPGALDSIGMLRNPGGLPGLSPGLFSGGGATQLGSGGTVVNPMTGRPFNGGRRRKSKNQQGGDVTGVSVADGSIAGRPSSGTPAQVYPQEATVGPNLNAPRAQMGGRYGMEIAPADLVLSPSNAVGMSGYAQNGRVGCEVGTQDALNANPGGIQTGSTLPSFAGVGNFTQLMKGGKRQSKNNNGYTVRLRKGKGRTHKKQQKQQKQQQQQGGKKKRSRKQQGGVVVGEVDAMRYYAPTAGYGNLPLMPQVPNNPGILMQLGYPAGHFNPACMKTN